MRWMKIGKQPETLQFQRRIWDIALRPNRMLFKPCLLPQCSHERGILWHTEWQLIRKIEEEVKKILRIMQNINHGNKERNLRKKAEAIKLIEDFQKHYESLYSLYTNLKEQVKKQVGGGDDNTSSTSGSDSESHHSQRGSKDASKVFDNDYQESEASDLEDTTILKDKLTCSSEVKKAMNPEPELAFSNPPELREVFKDLGVQTEEESEKTSQMLGRIKDLEGQVDALKIEVSNLCAQKTQLEEQVGLRLNEATQTKEEISRLEAQVLEMVAKSKEKECQCDSLGKQLVDNEQHYSSRISDLVAQGENMQHELDTLKHQKGELEEQYLEETKQWSSHVKVLMEQVTYLQKEVENVTSQKEELKLKLEKKTKETSEYLHQIQVLRNELSLNEQRTVEEKERVRAQINDLELEIKSLRRKKSEQEEQVKKTENEAFQQGFENEKLLEKISKLQTSLSEKEDELSIEQRKSKDSQTIASVKIKSLAEGVEHLKSMIESLQNEKQRLQVELEALQNDKKLLQMDLDKEKEISSQLEKISKTNFQLVERKVDELAEEFRKQYDDQLRILSRRIRVAEQLQVECKEWYQKTREMYGQETKEHKEVEERREGELKIVKDLTLAANELLTLLDSQALKFEECTGNLVNRISKASCELNFAKQWAMRKNKALLQVRDDMDCLVSQLDDREAEMLVFREKVWKSENKVRELEKIIKDHEDEMLVLNEEKREAIRQLCVWIDYHRGRSDFYKKTLFEMSTGRRRPS
ncbi:hypothetical protein ACS0TY_004128 [Phlomoides rotata]